MSRLGGQKSENQQSILNATKKLLKKYRVANDTSWRREFLVGCLESLDGARDDLVEINVSDAWLGPDEEMNIVYHISGMDRKYGLNRGIVGLTEIAWGVNVRLSPRLVGRLVATYEIAVPPPLGKNRWHDSAGTTWWGDRFGDEP